jgi:hypothetical protein
MVCVSLLSATMLSDIQLKRWDDLGNDRAKSALASFALFMSGLENNSITNYADAGVRAALSRSFCRVFHCGSP